MKQLLSAGWKISSGRCQISLGEWKATLLAHAVSISVVILYSDFMSKPCCAGKNLSDTIHQDIFPTRLQQPPSHGYPLQGIHMHTSIFTHSAHGKKSMNTSLLQLSVFQLYFLQVSDQPANPLATAHDSFIHYLGACSTLPASRALFGVLIPSSWFDSHSQSCFGVSS